MQRLGLVTLAVLALLGLVQASRNRLGLAHRAAPTKGPAAAQRHKHLEPAGIPSLSSQDALSYHDAWTDGDDRPPLDCMNLQLDRSTLPNDRPVLFPTLLKTYNRLTRIVNETTKGGWDARPFSIAHYGEQVDYYTRVGTSPGIRTVCEVGFNAGYSAAVWLESNPTVKVIDFDMQDQPFKKNCVAELQRLHPGRLELHAGNSQELVPAFVAQRSNASGVYTGPRCDLVHIDGDHSYQGARIDFVNLLPMMHCSTLVLMDDMCDDKHCHLFTAAPPQAPQHFEGPTAAWAEAKETGVLEELDTFFSWERNDKGWALGRINCHQFKMPSLPATPLFADFGQFQQRLRDCFDKKGCKPSDDATASW